MKYLYIITAILVLISFIADRKKTYKSFFVAYKKFKKILPAFLSMLILVSIIIFIIPEKTISRYLAGDNILISSIIAACIGSIAFMPGFIAFPLSGILLQNGVSYTVISSFTTTLMTVGFVTMPIEKSFFGLKVTIIRNLLYFIFAIIIAMITGIFFGEIF